MRLEREREKNDKVPKACPKGTSDTKRIHGVRVCDYRCSSLSSTTEPSARFIDSPGGTGRYGDFRQAPEGCRGLSPVSKRQELSSLVQRAGLSKRASGAGRLPHGPLRALEPRCELSKPPLTLLSSLSLSGRRPRAAARRWCLVSHARWRPGRAARRRCLPVEVLAELGVLEHPRDRSRRDDVEAR